MLTLKEIKKVRLAMNNQDYPSLPEQWINLLKTHFSTAFLFRNDLSFPNCITNAFYIAGMQFVSV